MKIPKYRDGYAEILETCAKTDGDVNKALFQRYCKDDLFFLLVYGLNRKFADNDWFFARCREVQDNPDWYLDLWAREHGKSLIITVTKTIQDILRDPEITVGIFSHTRPMAKSFLRVIKREFENNVKLKTAFDDILWADPHKESTKWSEDEGIIVKRKGNPPEATVEACGLVDGMPTGRHYQLRVYDDIVTADGVNSAEQIQKTTDALDMSQNLGKLGGTARMIGTRYKLGDSYEEYIKRGKFKPRIKPATDNGRADGTPVYFSQADWDDKLQSMSPAIIASQMLQNPLAADSVIFQPEWFNLWPSDKALPAFDAVYMAFDGATSERETADCSCLMAFGVFKAREGDARHSCMVLDCFMERVSYPQMRDEIIRQMQNKFGANDCPVNAIIIENKSSGQALIPEFRRSQMPVISYDPGRLDKVARANLVSHLVRDGVIWLPESKNPKRKGYPMSWLSAWHEQMLYFPNVKHDDGVDATVMFLAVMDKMGLIRGRKLPEQQMSYWRKQMKQSPYG